MGFISQTGGSVLSLVGKQDCFRKMISSISLTNFVSKYTRLLCELTLGITIWVPKRAESSQGERTTIELFLSGT